MGFMDNMKDALIASLRNPGDSAASRREFNERRNIRKYNELVSTLRLGAAALNFANGQTWSKYSASVNRDTGRPQTNYFEGYVGQRNQKLKVHIAVDDKGRLLYVRDIDGTVIFDRSRGDTPPAGWH